MVKLQDVEMKDVSMPPSEGGEKKEEEVKKDPDLLTLEGKNHPFRTPSLYLYMDPYSNPKYYSNPSPFLNSNPDRKPNQ